MPTPGCRRVLPHVAPERRRQGNHVLLLASPEFEHHRTLEAIDAGADDVLIKPVNEQTLRVRLSTTARMTMLREEMHRERIGIMRSADELAVAQKRVAGQR